MTELSATERLLARRARLDAMVENLAQELRVALRAAARELRPFPHFPDSNTPAIEAEPGGAAKAEYGCIVVGQDGELYEFTLSLSFAGDMPGEVSRSEDLREVRLAPHDYIPYAYAALREVTRQLVQRAEAGGGKF